MKRVLFVCTHNAGRSQMAQAFFERHAPPDLRAESAGSNPARRVWPSVIEVMREVGIDLSDRRPQKLTLEMQLHVDWAITMNCGDACPFVPTTVEDWDVADPAERSIDEVRRIRDEIELRVRDLIDNRADDIRADLSAHQARLARLLSLLSEEFEDKRTPEDIRACADAVLHRYDDATVRSFTMTFAHRRAAECLRGEGCRELSAA